MKIVREIVIADCPDLRARILALLDARYKTQRWLADRLGVPPQRLLTVFEYKSIDYVFVAEIERVLGVTSSFWTKPWSECLVDLVRMKREHEMTMFRRKTA